MKPVCVRVCGCRLYVCVCAYVCKNHGCIRIYPFVYVSLLVAVCTYICVRVYNVYVFVSLNVFLYKIGSSGSSTSRRTTLALRMKPDLQKYVARVFRVFGTFSPLSLASPSPRPESSPLLVQSRSHLFCTPIRFIHPSLSFHPFHTRSSRSSLSSMHTILSYISLSLSLPSSSSLPRVSPPHSHLAFQRVPRIEIRTSDRVHSSKRERSTPSRFLRLVASLFPLFLARFHHLRQQRSREGPLARRRENRQFR